MATIAAKSEREKCPHFEQAGKVARCWFERDRENDRPQRCIHLKQGDCEVIAVAEMGKPR